MDQADRRYYAYRLYHGPSSRVRVLLNGVPVYHCLASSDGEAPSITAQATHLLVPGLNTFRFEVWSAPDNMTGYFDLEEVAPEKRSIFRHEYPAPYEEWGKVPIPVRPTVQLGEFVADGVVVTPPWEDAEPVGEVPPHGNDELHLAAQSFHHALATKDAGKAVDLLQEKIRHMERVYPDHDAGGRHALRMFQEGLPTTRFRPYVPEELAFASYKDGRVVHVTRALGGHAIEGKGNDVDGFQTDLWLTKKHGAWRIFL